MAVFDSCCSYVLSHEGGLSHHPDDPGGITNFGISLRFLREVNADTLKRCGIFGDVDASTIENLTLAQAEKIYLFEFWNKAPFEKIMNPMSGKYIFDMAVNHGISQAVKISQRAVCATQRKRDFIKDDGLMGPKTIGAINQSSFMLIPALIAQRVGFVRELVALKPKLEVFLDGWLNRCYDI